MIIFKHPLYTNVLSVFKRITLTDGVRLNLFEYCLTKLLLSIEFRVLGKLHQFETTKYLDDVAVISHLPSFLRVIRPIDRILFDSYFYKSTFTLIQYNPINNQVICILAIRVRSLNLLVFTPTTTL